jgi:hypothetical protein
MPELLTGLQNLIALGTLALNETPPGNATADRQPTTPGSPAQPSPGAAAQRPPDSRAFSGVDAATRNAAPRSQLGALSLKALALTQASGGTLNKSQLAEAVKSDPSLQPLLDAWDAIFGAEGVAEPKHFDPARSDTAGGDILNQYDRAVNTQRAWAALQPSDQTPKSRRPQEEAPNEQGPLVPSTYVPVNIGR